MNGFDSTYALLLRTLDVLSSDQASLIVQATLATIFAISGTYRTRHPAAAATSALQFGIPVPPTRVIGYTIGAGELFLAVALLIPFREIAVVTLAASSALSLVFTVLTAGAVARGQSFDCSCVGSEPVSKSSVARAAAMLAASLLAAAIVANGGTRSITIEAALVAASMALIIVFLPHLRRVAIQVRTMRRDFEENVDWSWLINALGTHGEG